MTLRACAALASSPAEHIAMRREAEPLLCDTRQQYAE